MSSSVYTTGPNNQTTGDGVYRYLFDDEGNRIARFVDEDSSGTLTAGDTDITEYTWDHRNRLTEVAHRAVFGGAVDWEADYVYDLFDRRIGSPGGFRGHEPIVTYWERFGRFPAWLDWRDWSFQVCRITCPSVETVGSRRFFVTRTMRPMWN